MNQKNIHRRNFLKKMALLGIVCAGAGLGPYLTRKRKIFQKSILTMGTVGEIQIVHDDPRKASQIIDQALEEVLRVERLMSRFKEESDVGRANSKAFQQAVALSEETAYVVERGIHWSKITEGTFDPAIGKLCKLWDVKHHKGVPSEEILEKLRSRRFSQKVHILRKGSPSVTFTDPEVMLDLGGIAKGYAVDCAARSLQQNSIDQGLINVGGEIYALGGNLNSKAWRVGVRDPIHPQKLTQVLHLKNQAVATSGSYEQYFVQNNILYHHIIHPFSGKPAPAKFQSLSIIGNNCCDADALSTGLFFYTEKEIQKILEEKTLNFQSILIG